MKKRKLLNMNSLQRSTFLSNQKPVSTEDISTQQKVDVEGDDGTSENRVLKTKNENINLSSIFKKHNSDFFSNPRNHSSIFARIMTSWLNRFITKALFHHYTPNEMPPVPENYEAERLENQFKSSHDKYKNKKFSAVYALVDMFWIQLLTVQVLHSFTIAANLILPSLEHFILQSIFGTGTISWFSKWYSGVIFAAALFAILMFSLGCSQLRDQYLLSLNIKIETILISVIYSKTLKLSHKALLKTDGHGYTGMIVCEVTNAAKVVFQIPFLWEVPIITVLSIVLINYEMSWSALTIIVIIVFIIPVYIILFVLVYKNFATITRSTLLSNRLIGSVIKGIKLIKTNTWEDVYVGKIVNFRKKLVWKIIRYLFFFLLLESLKTLSPLVMQMIVFTSFLLNKEPFRDSFTAEKVFPTMSFISLFAGSISAYPTILTQFFRARNAFRKISEYIQMPEFKRRKHFLHKDWSFAIQMENCVFEWEGVSNEEKKKKKRRKEKEKLENKRIASRYINNSIIQQPFKIDLSAVKENKKIINDPTRFLSVEKIDIKKGSLVLIIGPTGSGKSSFLEGIIGEMKKNDGKIVINGKFSYCSQNPMILNGTIKKNILFGREYDENQFKEVIRICNFEQDFKDFKNGIDTKIISSPSAGETITLCQKQRIALARALYLNSEIIFLDDLFWMIDPPIGKSVYNNLSQLCKEKGKTIVMITNQIEFLKNSDWIIVMNKMKVVEQGTYQEIMKSNKSLKKIVEEETINEKEEEELKRELKEETENRSNQRHISHIDRTYTQNSYFEDLSNSLISETLSDSSSQDDLDKILEINMQNEVFTLHNDLEKFDFKNSETKNRTHAHEDAIKNDLFSTSTKVDEKSEIKVVEEEEFLEMDELESGNVKLSTYWWYLRTYSFSKNIFMTILELFFFILMEIVVEIMTNFPGFWLSVWTMKDKALISFIHTNTFLGELSDKMYFYIFLGGSALIPVLMVVKYLILSIFGYLSGFDIYKRMTKRLVYSPMDFFFHTPIGGILNRTSRDQQQADILILSFNSFSMLISSIISTFSFLIITNYFIAIPTAIAFIAYVIIQWLYRNASMQVKRIDSVMKSPILSSLHEMINGIKTIRAFGVEKWAKKENYQILDNANKTMFLDMYLNIWLKSRLGIINVLLVASSSFLIIFFANVVKNWTGANFGISDLTGISLTKLFSGTKLLEQLILLSVTIEKQLNSIERLKYYITNLKPKNKGEKDSSISESVSSCDSNEKKKIEFCNVWMNYRSFLPFVLKDISFVVNKGEKVSIIGHSGSGKTSIFEALLRTHPYKGNIYVDRQSSKSMKICDLRKKISLIEQKPFLFPGSVRDNLDPKRVFHDFHIWLALETCQLRSLVESFPKKLDQVIAGYGIISILSDGQKQLLCLARALLNKSEIICLDEATTRIDHKTRKTIHQIMEKSFFNCTVLSITHDVSTIAHFNKLLVIDQGKILFFDEIEKLIEKKGNKIKKILEEEGIDLRQVKILKKLKDEMEKTETKDKQIQKKNALVRSKNFELPRLKSFEFLESYKKKGVK